MKIILTNAKEETFVHVFDAESHEKTMKAFLDENVGIGSDNNPWKLVDIFLPVPLLQVLNHHLIVSFLFNSKIILLHLLFVFSICFFYF